MRHLPMSQRIVSPKSSHATILTPPGETESSSAEEQLDKGYPGQRCVKAPAPDETPLRGTLNISAMPQKTFFQKHKHFRSATQNPEEPKKARPGSVRSRVLGTRRRNQ